MCSLTRKDEQWIRDRFQFPDSVKIRIPSDKERACHSYANEVCFYEADFTSGLVSCMVVWMFANVGDVIKRDKFLYFYRLRKSKDPGYYEFKPWDRASRLILDYPLSL